MLSQFYKCLKYIDYRKANVVINEGDVQNMLLSVVMKLDTAQITLKCLPREGNMILTSIVLNSVIL